jgi:hypothetical protein
MLVNKQLKKLNRKFRKLDLVLSSGSKEEEGCSVAAGRSVLCQHEQVPQLVKKLPAFYGNPKFITTLTTVRHMSVSRARVLQPTHSHPMSSTSILALISHLMIAARNCLQTTH